jgi:serine/threonine-protein phosphatase 2B catalytic subunit
LRSRRSDIENERLPPDLVDADSEEAKILLSNPTTPHESQIEPPPPSMLAGRLNELATGASSGSPASPASLGSPVTPSSPGLPSPGTYRGGHRRQASLGTTKTSPSTRRRSLENTISLIKEVVDGEDPADGEWSRLADSLAGTPDGSKGTPAASR